MLRPCFTADFDTAVVAAIDTPAAQCRRQPLFGAAPAASAADEARKSGGVRPLITAPLCRLSGPARAHPAMLTAIDRWGEYAPGKLLDHAIGFTPWGTYLACEARFSDYFKAPPIPTADQQRYGIGHRQAPSAEADGDERFDLSLHPNEINRYGWLVEIDPRNPKQTPVKRTALGRFQHQAATVAVAGDGRVVVYMADDDDCEYLYKFVSRHRYQPDAASNLKLLDEGTLHVARFGDDGKGQWLPLRHGEKLRHGALIAERGYSSPGDVVIRCRQAADLAGASPLARPKGMVVDPQTGKVSLTLGNASPPAVPEAPVRNGATPCHDHSRVRILRWRENGHDTAALSFEWDIVTLIGTTSGSASPLPHPAGGHHRSASLAPHRPDRMPVAA